MTYGWYTVLLPDGFMYNYTYSSSPGMGYMVGFINVPMNNDISKAHGKTPFSIR